MFRVVYSIEKLCVGRMNICMYTSILVCIYGTKRFLSCDDLVVVGAGGGMSFLYVCTLKII